MWRGFSHYCSQVVEWAFQTLTGRVISVTVSILGVTFVLMAANATHRTHAQLVANQQSRASAIAMTIQAAQQSAEDNVDVSQWVDDVAASNPQLGVNIRTVSADLGLMPDRMRAQIEAIQDVAKNSEVIATGLYVLDPDVWVSAYAPVFVSHAIDSWIVVDVAMSDKLAHAHTETLNYLASWCMAFLVLIFGIVGTCLPLSRSIQRLNCAVFALAQGDLSVAMPEPVDPSLVGMAGSFEDIRNALVVSNNRQQNAEHALGRALCQTQHAASTRNDFLARMSHETRTPMNGVLGMTRVLLETPLTFEQRGCVQTIFDSATHLMSMLDDIIDYTDLVHDVASLQQISFDPGRSVEKIVTGLGVQAHRSNLELVCLVDDSVPVSVLGDQGRFEQVLTGIAGNAIKFTTEGQVCVSISAESSHDQKVWLRIEVADTGERIPAEHVARLFDPFTQEEAPNDRQQGGLGVGLALCRRLVGLMDGTIGVVGNVGGGNTFWVRVPMGACPVDVQPVVAELSGLRLLLVDSCAATQQGIAMYVRQWGGVCEHVSDEGQARMVLRRAPRGYFDAMIIADKFAEHEGGGVLPWLVDHADHPNIAVVRLAACGAQIEDKGEGVVVKPVVRQDLLRQIGPVTKTISRNEPTVVDITSSSVPSGTILVVEDNAINQKVIAMMLTRMGYQCDVVSDGRQAIERVRQGSYALVLMDCHMPNMDGFAATEALRAMGNPCHRLPIIALTASVSPRDRTRCVEVGMDDFVSKPIDSDNLRHVVSRWLKQRNIA